MTELALYPYQREGVDWLKSLDRGGILADDMGLGKTIETLKAALELNAKRVLIVTLNSTRRVWENELKKWFPLHRYVNIDAWTMDDLTRRIHMRDKSNQFVIVGYEMMRKYVDELEKTYWDVVIVDEAQKIKNRQSLTHKAHRTLVRKSTTDRVWYVTGTPVENHAEDYWPMLRSVAPGFGSYWNFADKFCNVEKIVKRCRVCWHEGHFTICPASTCSCTFPPEVLGTSVTSISDENHPKVKRLVSEIRPYVLRRTKEQVFDQMPEKTYTRVPLAMDSYISSPYRSMEKKLCATIEGQLITCDSELSQQVRLIQICTDPMLLLGEQIAKQKRLQGPKASALLDLVEQLDPAEPFVVFSQWSTVVEMTKNLLEDEGIACSRFTGDNSQTREEELEAWNQGRTRALLVTISAGGVGRDFTHAATAIFTDRSWNPKQNEQAEDRLHRHGQTRAVSIYDLFISDSIEETNVFPTIDAKTAIAESIVESLV